MISGHLDDRLLEELGAGTLTSQRYADVLRHARACHRCAPRYEKAIVALRQMEHRSPFEPAQVELESIAALDAGSWQQAPAPAGGRGWAWWTLGLAAVAAVVLVVAPRPVAVPDDELRSRGAPGEFQASLRVFCGGGGGPLDELEAPDEPCAPGRSLAFAAGARAPLSRLVLEVRGLPVEPLSHQGPVEGAQGAEQPLPVTVPLRQAGTVEVVVAFAPAEAEALAAARGQERPGATVLKRRVEVR